MSTLMKKFRSNTTNFHNINDLNDSKLSDENDQLDNNDASCVAKRKWGIVLVHFPIDATKYAHRQ